MDTMQNIGLFDKKNRPAMIRNMAEAAANNISANTIMLCIHLFYYLSGKLSTLFCFKLTYAVGIISRFLLHILRH